ncbi:MAG: hypothetical protein OXI96_00220 [Acidimicrobiaceae bacterium]|nr:hypothetical protein [Acidimicrobiaceae bacterium]
MAEEDTHFETLPAAVAPKIDVAPLTGAHHQFDQIMPVVLFLVFYNFGNTEIAVLAATAWSIKAAYSRLRRGLPIGTWLPVITVYLLVRAAVSIAVERNLVDFGVSGEAVYFGTGIATKVLIGLIMAGSVLVGKPLALWAADKVLSLPEAMRSHPVFVTTLRNVTWVAAFYELASSVWDVWLFNNAELNIFLVGRQVFNFIMLFLLILATFVYVDKRFSKLLPGWPGMAELLSPNLLSGSREHTREQTSDTPRDPTHAQEIPGDGNF